MANDSGTNSRKRPKTVKELELRFFQNRNRHSSSCRLQTRSKHVTACSVQTRLRWNDLIQTEVTDILNLTQNCQPFTSEATSYFTFYMTGLPIFLLQVRTRYIFSLMYGTVHAGDTRDIMECYAHQKRCNIFESVRTRKYCLRFWCAYHSLRTFSPPTTSF